MFFSENSVRIAVYLVTYDIANKKNIIIKIKKKILSSKKETYVLKNLSLSGKEVCTVVKGEKCGLKLNKGSYRVGIVNEIVVRSAINIAIIINIFTD